MSQQFFAKYKRGISMSDVVYTSRVRIERIKGPYRKAYLPVEDTPIAFGVHSEVAEHYGTDLNIHEPHSTTLDYVVAAAGG
jgi:hypothetical protein